MPDKSSEMHSFWGFVVNTQTYKWKPQGFQPHTRIHKQTVGQTDGGGTAA